MPRISEQQWAELMKPLLAVMIDENVHVVSIMRAGSDVNLLVHSMNDDTAEELVRMFREMGGAATWSGTVEMKAEGSEPECNGH